MVLNIWFGPVISLLNTHNVNPGLFGTALLVINSISFTLETAVTIIISYYIAFLFA
jgi:hypothetical protein